jgi:hypothetical protein
MQATVTVEGESNRQMPDGNYLTEATVRLKSQRPVGFLTSLLDRLFLFHVVVSCPNRSGLCAA